MQIHVWTGSKYVPQDVYENMQPASSLAALKTAQKQQCEQTYYSRLAAGYYDGTLGIRLAATQHDQNMFGNLVAMHLLAQTDDAATLTIADHGGEFQQLPYGTFKGLMLRFGAWCAAEWSALVSAKQAIDAAADKSAVKAVVYE
jgi:hypothetical protein